MAKFILFTDSILSARYDDEINTIIPSDAIEVDGETFFKTINEQDGIWSLIKGKVKKTPFPELSAEVQMENAVEAVRIGLQSAINEKAKALGFSGGNALMLYAGFGNPFQTLAQTFATWEASVWVEAEAYKARVIAGEVPMLTPDEAVAMMPASQA